MGFVSQLFIGRVSVQLRSFNYPGQQEPWGCFYYTEAENFHRGLGQQGGLSGAAANWPAGNFFQCSKQFRTDGLVSLSKPTAAQTARRRAGEPHSPPPGLSAAVTH